MSDTRKYYYLKLKDNFFDSDELKLMESMKDGYLYSNILLKLYLRSLKSNGKLVFNNRIPYNSEMLATITNHTVGTIKQALVVFGELGLIEILDNGTIYMLDIQNFIGESSTEADRIRAYRNKIDKEKQTMIDANVTNVQHLYTRDRDRDRDRDRTQEKDTTNVVSQKKTTKKFIKPTVEEVQAYINEKGYNIDPHCFIDYYESNGWKVGRNSMKDWKAAVRNWARNEKMTTIQAKVKSDWEKDWSNEKDGWGED